MPKRRDKGSGSLFFDASKGAWVGRIELPPGPKGRRQKVVQRKSKADLIKELTRLRKTLEANGDIPSDNLTVTGWCDYWVREIGVKTRRPKTIASYRSILDGWVKPVAGKVRLDQISPATIRKVLTAMDAAGKSSTYQRNAHSVMAAVFADAEREQRIPRNPVELVIAPRKAVTHLEALTPLEATNLLTTFGDSPDAYLWATYLLTGARRGEILGLEWDRVTDELDLSWQLQRIGYTHGCDSKCGNRMPDDCPQRYVSFPAGFEHRQIEGGLYWTRPKSRAGTRIVPLVEPLAGILARWRAIAPTNPWGLVFTRTSQSDTQLPLDPDYISRLWPEVLEAAGVKKELRLHDIRHTTVDLLSAAGVPDDVIGEIVGHSSALMTRQYKSKGNRATLTKAMQQLSTSLGY